MDDHLYLDILLQLLVKDTNTYEHSLRVGRLCKLMANQLQLNERQTHDLILGGCLHDIGKILIPDEILNKDSSLTSQEWKKMKQHPFLGSNLMTAYKDINQTVLDIIEFHHERWDGKGYPYGISGGRIPVFARICAIIDTYDCMVSDRPYRKGLSFQEAEEELLLHSGTQFDKEYVDLFVSVSHSIGEIYPFKNKKNEV